MVKLLDNMHILGFALVISAASMTAVGLTGDSSNTALEGPSENIQTEEGANVYVYKNGELVASEHNALMDGEEAIEQQIRSGSAYSWDHITLGNGTAPGSGDSTLDSEISGCGLGPKQGTFDDNGDGDWNLTVTFDSTCDDIDVNTTAQYSNDGTPNPYFAGADLGRTINLYSGDSLTIEWNNQVS